VKRGVRVLLSMCHIFVVFSTHRYIGMMQKNDDFDRHFDHNSVLKVTDINRKAASDVWASYAIDRMRMFKRAQEAGPEKIPKELARIIEQTLIPVYMDGAQRPPRKCRLISS
jgi:hypothetical protein